MYKIHDYKCVTIGKRIAVILKLVDMEQTCVECWSTKYIQEELEEKKDLWHEQKLFIVSRGKKKSQNPRDIYYDFEIIVKKKIDGYVKSTDAESCNIEKRTGRHRCMQVKYVLFYTLNVTIKQDFVIVIFSCFIFIFASTVVVKHNCVFDPTKLDIRNVTLRKRKHDKTE